MKKFPIIIEIVLFMGCSSSCGLILPDEVSRIATITLSKSQITLSPNNPTLTHQVTVFPTHRPDPTGQLMENGWYRFVNYESGYYIEYPPTTTMGASPFEIFDYGLLHIDFPRTIDPNGVAMTIITYQIEEIMSLDQFAEEEIDRFLSGKTKKYTENINKYSAIISNHPAIIVETSGYYKINVFIGTEERFYSLVLSPNMMRSEGTTDGAVELFKAILFTFTIMN